MVFMGFQVDFKVFQVFKELSQVKWDFKGFGDF